jgi:chemotaxis protein CheD
MKIVAQGSVELITYALGSCLGLVLYDPVTRVTGLLHAMMPTASIAPDKAAKNPAMFVDTGVPELFKACYRAGAEKKRLIVIAAGCAAVNAAPGMDLFQIGRRNVVVLRKLLWKNGVLLAKHDLEGSDSRTISISTDTGKVTLTTRGKQRVL